MYTAPSNCSMYALCTGVNECPEATIFFSIIDPKTTLGQKLKSIANCRLWVYNAEMIQPPKRNSKKVFFWDTLVNTFSLQVVPWWTDVVG